MPDDIAFLHGDVDEAVARAAGASNEIASSLVMDFSSTSTPPTRIVQSLAQTAEAGERRTFRLTPAMAGIANG